MVGSTKYPVLEPNLKKKYIANRHKTKIIASIHRLNFNSDFKNLKLVVVHVLWMLYLSSQCPPATRPCLDLP